MVDKVAYETDGTTFTIKSDNIPVLETPFGHTTTALAEVLGLEPSTGVPVYSPHPAPTQIITAPPQPSSGATGGSVTCTSVKCGAAIALTQQLETVYSQIAAAINTGSNLAISSLVTGFVGGLLAFVDGLFGGLNLPLDAATILIITRVATYMGNFTLYDWESGAPSWTTTQAAFLQNACWCSLDCTGTQVLLTKAMIDAWQSRVVSAPSGTWVNLQQDFIGAILLAVGDFYMGDWATVAATGANSPSPACDAYVCS
jgi:hypothetical protein